MNIGNLEQSDLKDKYFVRTERWDWLTKDMIHVYDSKNPRIITMDPWPQQIYLDAIGNMTVKEYIFDFAKRYPKKQIPDNLADIILDVVSGLIIEEKIVEISDYPVQITDSLKNPMTEEGVIDLPGEWKGTYTYNMPDKYKDAKTQEVEFIIRINDVKGKQFSGTVEDNLNTGGTPGAGKIYGKFNEEEIWFDKNMPVHTIIDENGNHVTDESKKHPSILYKGTFSRSKKCITGYWHFRKKKLYWKGIIPFLYSFNGSFMMNKIENN